MMFKMTELKYRPDPVLEHALDVLFILHADHEQNCSHDDDAGASAARSPTLTSRRRRGCRARRPASRLGERGRSSTC
jgi:hypothetical protein